jgi:6-phosphogluconolactonase
LTYEDEIPSGGREPRGFVIDPSGTFLLAAHEKSDNVVVFRIDPLTGGLYRTGQETKVSQPVCVRFVHLK